MTEQKDNSSIGSSWDEARQELFTPEEIAASDLRVAKNGDALNERVERDILNLRVLAECFQMDGCDIFRANCLMAVGTLHELTAQLAESQRRAQDARNELCQKCGRYHEAHNGACNGCRWKG